MHRLRIGLAGLVSIGMLTFLVSLISDNASNEAPVAPVVADGTMPAELGEATGEDGNSEPLVDLGVVPVAPATGDNKSESAVAPPPGLENGQRVPDLKPKSNIANDPG